MLLDRRSASIWICAVLCVVTLALVIVGCGGKSDTSQPSTVGSNSASEASSAGQGFVAQADGICARINAEILSFKVKSASRAEVIRVVPPTLAVERKGIAELEKLAAPTSISAVWGRMLGNRRTLAAELAQLLAIAKKNDGRSIKVLAAAKRHAHAALTKEAKQAGFKDCGKIGRVG
jgi:hypothetical protein